MQELIRAICRLLADAGLTVVRQFYPGTAPELTGPVTAVGLQGAKSGAAAQFSYLGMREDDDGGCTALYGCELTAEVLMQVFAPRRGGSAACYAETEKVVAALSGGAAGIQLGSLTVGACSYDAESDCFTCPVRAQAQAYVYAVTDEDETEFTDFILKGAVK